MFNRPRRTYAVLVTLAVAAFAVSATGNGKGPHSGGLRYWASATGWAGFGLLVLATVLYTLALGVRSIARHRAPTTIK